MRDTIPFKSVTVNSIFYDTYSREKWKKLSDTDAVLVHTDYPIVGDYFNDDELVEIEE